MLLIFPNDWIIFLRAAILYFEKNFYNEKITKDNKTLIYNELLAAQQNRLPINLFLCELNYLMPVESNNFGI